jgi:hypothetical protein
VKSARHWRAAGPSQPSARSARYRLGAAALATLLVVAGHHLDLAAHRADAAAPEQALAIRAALFRLASATRALPAGMTSADAAKALQRSIADRDAAIDAARFPGEVDVTYRDLGRWTCIEAETVARRLEGQVVVQLEGYPAASDCSARNAMTWQVMP